MKRFALSSLLRQVPGKPEVITDVLGDWASPLIIRRRAAKLR